MSTFAPSEIFQFAIRIEKNGEVFYNRMVKKLDNADVKKLFVALAEDEVNHRRLFEKMVSKIEKYEPYEIFPQEYFDYLHAYVDNVVFDENKLAEKISNIADEQSALSFAIENEVSSILFYQDMKNLVSEGQRGQIDEIIQEERRHFVRLTHLRSIRSG